MNHPFFFFTAPNRPDPIGTGSDINSISNNKVRHFETFATTALMKAMVPKVGKCTPAVLGQWLHVNCK